MGFCPQPSVNVEIQDYLFSKHCAVICLVCFLWIALCHEYLACHPIEYVASHGQHETSSQSEPAQRHP